MGRDAKRGKVIKRKEFENLLLCRKKIKTKQIQTVSTIFKFRKDDTTSNLLIITRSTKFLKCKKVPNKVSKIVPNYFSMLSFSSE